MAYKFSTGSVERGDIYYEDDAQGNTFLDWSEDALGVVAGGAQALVVSSSTVGIGTAAPKYAFVIAGDNKRLHMGAIDDVSNYTVDIHLAEDATTGGEMARGGFIKFDGDYPADSGHGQLQIGVRDGYTTNVNVFRIDRDATANSLCIIDSGQVGIGLTTPTSILEVSGSQAGNLFESATSFTMNATHFMVAITGDTMTGTLPAASGCGGRIYHIFNQAGDEHGGASIEVSCSGGDTIDGSGALTIDSSEEGGGNSSVSLVSNGDDSWLIFGQYSPSE